MARRNQDFQAIRSEGGLLPSDLLRRVIDPRSNLSGTKSEDYGLPVGERLNEVITQSWNRLRRHWTEFRTANAHLPEGEAGTGLTNDKWSLPLLRELGFGLLPTSAGPEVGGRAYAISRFFGPVPIHLVGCGLSLDHRAAGQRGAAAVNPHGLVQEFLNRSPAHLWGIVSNGLRLRILRDNQALSRQSFIEFDLEAMFSGEIYADFVLLWLVAHATRFAPRESSRTETCWLEQWTKEAEEQGTRALTDLQGGVERALQVLGEGFTTHPKNTALREVLRSGGLSLADFHGQLLRVVYRLIFLFVAEDRTLEGAPLLHPRDNSEADRIARKRYAAHYSATRLRDLAGSIKGSRHGDLWRQFQLLVIALSGETAGKSTRRHLALPALGSFLWNPASTAALNDAELMNFDLLEALRHLAFTRQGKVLRPVDYKNLGAEELGGVYESLLTLTPQISADGARFTFAEFAGNERKTSGSYYTPNSLVQCLLDSALDPVVEDAIRSKVGVEAEKAILALKVCDPAVGSGHFLVGAAHRLARHLARVRALAQGESEPSPLLYQHALRDVIGRCLYGVDVNPMAAELCRVGLWLEALEPGKPLSFLDHHIRVGNSLLGATPALIAAGLPDDAFSAIEGDDKKACAVLKKRNKAEREGVGPLFALQDAETQARLQHAAAELEELPDDRPEDIRAKELAFRGHEQTEEYRHKRLLADAWCAAFVIKKHFSEPGREASASGITQGHLNDLASGQPLPACLASEAEHISSQYQFFHWHLAFPEVLFAQGGFDCVLGNPPWERVKIQEKEWFAERSPEIATAPNSAARKRLIEALKAGNPVLHRRFLDDLRKAEGESTFLRNSGRYPFCGRGDINLYTVFAEGMRSLVNDRGRMGCVLPTGIATDDTTQFFFQDVIEKRSLVSLYSFENEGLIFPAVHHATKFCLFCAGAGRKLTARAAQFVFFARLVEQLNEEERLFSLSAEDIALLNPNTRTCPIFRSRHDAEISKAMYRRVPVFVRDTDELGNQWGLEVRTRLWHTTEDAEHFRSKDELSKEGWQLSGNTFLRMGTRHLPLYEGKMVHQFDHRFGTYAGQTQAQANQGKLPELDEYQHADPQVVSQPHCWIPENQVYERLEGTWERPWLFGWRDITSAVVYRTVVASVVPRGACADSLPLMFPTNATAADVIPLLLANLNSFVCDYAARQKVGGTHLRFFVLKQLPVLPPSAYATPIPWLAATPAAAGLLARVLELTYTAWDLEQFARDCGWFGPPFRWDENRRFQLRCELDAAFFHLYLPAEKAGNWRVAEGETAEELTQLRKCFPTPRDAVTYILDTFPIVRRRDEERFDGDYRTKRVILEVYDAMQDSILTGQAYQTPLNPPPGPPIDSNGKFVDYAEVAASPPPHIHLSRDHASTGAELHLSDLARGFPKSPFIVRLGAQASAGRIRVTPVATADLKVGEPVILATPALRLHGETVTAAIGKLGIKSRSDASSGEHYVLASVRGDGGMAQARLSEAEWKSLTSIGRVETLG